MKTFLLVWNSSARLLSYFCLSVFYFKEYCILDAILTFNDILRLFATFGTTLVQLSEWFKTAKFVFWGGRFIGHKENKKAPKRRCFKAFRDF